MPLWQQNRWNILQPPLGFFLCRIISYNWWIHCPVSRKVRLVAAVNEEDEEESEEEEAAAAEAANKNLDG